VPDLTRWSYDHVAEGKEKGWTEVLEMEDLGVETGNVPFDEQLRHFVSVVRDGVKPSCSGEEGRRG
jgi:hypothetical protein